MKASDSHLLHRARGAQRHRDLETHHQLAPSFTHVIADVVAEVFDGVRDTHREVLVFVRTKGKYNVLYFPLQLSGGD